VKGGRSVLLLEIRTEEIPARMLDGALRDLGRALGAALAGARLFDPGAAGAPRAWGTPRRLAARADGVLPRQPDEEVEVLGPAVRAAYDDAGRPTRAAQGFARAQEIRVEDLVRVATARGECVAARKRRPGEPAAAVLARVLPAAVLSLTFPKTMRWGAGDHVFVRPIHGVVALLDREVVPLAIAGIAAGRTTRGHRLAGEEPVVLETPEAYLDALRSRLVLADPAERRARIAEGLADAARGCGGRIAAPAGCGAAEGDPELLDEVTHMVEWPHVVAGSFDAAYLELPSEIPMTAMRHHQKFFALRGPDGALLDRFLAVANVPGDPAGAIRRGYEWVLRARLADARFFWEEDRRRSPAEHLAGLERLTFHEKLGTYRDKSERIARLAEAIAPAFAAAGQAVDPRAAIEAASLCKADLVTLMVGEFPELQGIVGGLYARADGRTAAVADAIYGHYLPRGADDAPPPTAEGAVVSLADRLDTQAGFFLLGQAPTGSRDPYGLRRSVQGVIRIACEKRVRLSLARLLDRALAGYAGAPPEGAVAPERAREALLEFYRGRMQHLGETAGLRADAVRAALAAAADDPLDARLRMTALDALRDDPGFPILAAAHKRIKNILKDQERSAFDPAGVREEAEAVLAREAARVRPDVEGAAGRLDYGAALRSLAGIAPALDRFFAEVMVLAGDARLRANRVALLMSLADLFLAVGDFSEIAVEGGAAERRAAAPAGGLES
jgi:glycyl-tRNA synthetase beta chain